jgi:hypothetical protein
MKWNGIIAINNINAEVRVSIESDGILKKWFGEGNIISDGVLEPGNYNTELGNIVVTYINLVSGEFTFLGSGRPLINIDI